MTALGLRANTEDLMNSISPRREIGAYEAMWLQEGASFKSIADRFAADAEALPSDFVSPADAEGTAAQVFAKIKASGVHRFGVRIHHAGDYPARLRDAKHPIELLYYRGIWELAETPSVAIVGSRKASLDGIRRAAKLAAMLVTKGFTVASGLAAGIDQAAHRAAIRAGGRTIAVVGTPLGKAYPKEHADLQEEIAERHLLISQVPVLRYERQDFRFNRLFFPERNATMSALTKATVIVEASDTSGTLTQARAAMHQGRKLFILNSCFERSDISWPKRFEALGAIRVREFDEVLESLA